MKLNYSFFIVIIIALVSCAPAGKKLSGSLIKADNMNVYFDLFDPVTNTSEVIGKTETNNRGDFSLDLPANMSPGIYRVRVGTKVAFLVLDKDPVEGLEFKGDIERFEKFDYQVNGSAPTTELTEIMNRYVRREFRSEGLIELVRNQAHPLVGMLIANISMKAPSFADVHAAVNEKVLESFPDVPAVKGYGQYVTQLQAQQRQSQIEGKIKVGSPAPDIAFPNPDGKMYKLSDLKGKTVLLDFWASWCGPCRKANPHVVDIYKKYKEKGFTVFSVSLDGLDDRTKRRIPEDQVTKYIQNQKDRWIAAIAQDQLEWEYHVSDLKKWNSAPAADYGVRSIPKTFLIDKNGNIAAINPKANLEQEILKVM